MNPLVSVVIPNYNYGAFLARTIRSVLEQRYAPVEILVIDDQSKDDSVRVARDFGDAVRVIEQANSGVSVARNRGIAEARGDFIAFLDADDLWHADKLLRQMPRFIDSAVGLVHTGVVYIDREDRPLGASLSGGSGFVLQDHALLRSTVLAGGSTAVVRRRCFDELGGFAPTLSTSADWDMWRRIAAHWRISMVREPLTSYRLHSTAMHRNVALFERDMLHAFERMFADPTSSSQISNPERCWANLHMVLAASYLRQGERRRALEHMGRSVRLDPRMPIGYLMRYPGRAWARFLSES